MLFLFFDFTPLYGLDRDFRHFDNFACQNNPAEAVPTPPKNDRMHDSGVVAPPEKQKISVLGVAAPP